MINLKVRKGEKFEGSTFMTGFHGIGETGYIAISYIVDALKAERIGFIDVKRPPPFITASSKGIITPFEIYKSGSIVLLKLEFPPHKTEEAELLKTLSRWIINEKFKDVVLIGGLDSNFKTGRYNLKIVPTSSYRRDFNRFRFPVLDQGLFVYGPLATLLSEFEINGFPAVAILPYAESIRADPRAASIAIKNISRAYKLKVDVKELERDAKEIEEELDKKIRQAKETSQGVYV